MVCGDAPSRADGVVLGGEVGIGWGKRLVEGVGSGGRKGGRVVEVGVSVMGIAEEKKFEYWPVGDD